MADGGRRPSTITAGALAVVLVCAGALAVAVVAAARPAAAQAPPAGAGGELELGRHLYLRDCAFCHAPGGEGTPRGPDIRPSGEAGNWFMVATGRMPIDRADEPLRRRPSIYDDEEALALARYAGTLGDGPPLPDVDADRGDVARGAALYQVECAGCHSATGIGGNLTAGFRAPPVLHSSPLEVVTSLFAGPGAMPAFAPEAFTPSEMDALARYVVELQSPEDRGGFPLLRAGRVDEGLVAWTLGLGTIVLFAAFLGARMGRAP